MAVSEVSSEDIAMRFSLSPFRRMGTRLPAEVSMERFGYGIQVPLGTVLL